MRPRQARSAAFQSSDQTIPGGRVAMPTTILLLSGQQFPRPPEILQDRFHWDHRPQNQARVVDAGKRETNSQGWDILTLSLVGLLSQSLSPGLGPHLPAEARQSAAHRHTRATTRSTGPYAHTGRHKARRHSE